MSKQCFICKHGPIADFSACPISTREGIDEKFLCMDFVVSPTWSFGISCTSHSGKPCTVPPFCMKTWRNKHKIPIAKLEICMDKEVCSCVETRGCFAMLFLDWLEMNSGREIIRVDDNGNNPLTWRKFKIGKRLSSQPELGRGGGRKRRTHSVKD